MTIPRGALLVGLLVSLTSANLSGRQSADLVQLGNLRVPSCPRADDPQYGLTSQKAIPIGGGPMYMAARQRNYLASLRGPGGQPVRVESRVGSGPRDVANGDMTIVDTYTVVYDGATGPVTTSIFMDAYHFALPRVPAGFTCGSSPVTAVGIPPVDPFKLTPAMMALAIQQGSKASIAPIPLDTTSARGYLYDRLAMMAVLAKAAADAGSPLDPAKPPNGLDPQGFTVLAYPIACGGRQISVQNVEMRGAQGPIPLLTQGEGLRGAALQTAFPGVPVPAGSLGLRFRNVQPTEAIITYAEGCDGAPASVTLPFRAEAPRLEQSAPGVIPPGIVEADPVIYVQTFLDADGRFSGTEYLGGPRSLLPAALEALAKWSARPVRINGVPIVNPTILQIPLR